MKFIKKIIKLIIIAVIIFVTFTILNISIDGYQMYKEAISEITLEDKVNEIKKRNDYIKYDELPEHYKNAVIAIEDHRFEKHGGIDYISTIRAIVKNLLAGKLVEGGSTITQQLAKNMYFTREKKFERKVAELFVVFELEREYSKDDILTMYINIMYFGNGYYGIAKASRGYLYKEPKQMNLYEATLLAGLPNAPSIYALNANPDLAKERQKQVVNSMVKYNYITNEEAQEVISINE